MIAYLIVDVDDFTARHRGVTRYPHRRISLMNSAVLQPGLQAKKTLSLWQLPIGMLPPTQWQRRG